MAGGESGGSRRLAQLGVDQRLEILVEMDVLQGTAAHADEVMVVVDERLGQFEMGVIGAAGDPADHPTPLQYLEIPVGRTLGQVVGVIGDLGKGHRPSNLSERFHEVSPAAGVAMIVALQAAGNRSVEIGHRVVVEPCMPPARCGARGGAGWRTHQLSIS